MDRIMDYFIKEKDISAAAAGVLKKPLTRYADIEKEFCYWLEHRNYDAPDAVTIDGYTAKRIAEIAPFLDGSGVYQFMVTLRDNPVKAHDYIKNGFPTK